MSVISLERLRVVYTIHISGIHQVTTEQGQVSSGLRYPQPPVITTLVLPSTVHKLGGNPDLKDSSLQLLVRLGPF